MDGLVTRALRSSFVAALLLVLGRGAAPAATVPAYSVTDLGVGYATLSTDAAGRGVVTGTNGATYGFQVTNHNITGSTADALLASLPSPGGGPTYSPMTYGNPANAFSKYLNSNVFLNDNGTLVFTQARGVYGHIASSSSGVEAAQRQADGTFGPITSLFGSSENGEPPNGEAAKALALNNLGQVLLTATVGSNHYTMLSNVNTGTSTDLRDLLPPDWRLDGALGLDDSGQLLVAASQRDKFYVYGPDHTLLLSPAGSPTPVPEPTALVTLALGAVALGARRFRRRASV